MTAQYGQRGDPGPQRRGVRGRRGPERSGSDASADRVPRDRRRLDRRDRRCGARVRRSGQIRATGAGRRVGRAKPGSAARPRRARRASSITTTCGSPTKLERQVEALSDQPRRSLSAPWTSSIERRDGAGDQASPRSRRTCSPGMLMFDGTETVSCSSTGLVRRDELLRMGGFDPALSMSADWDLLFRMLLAGAVAYVDDPLVRYRVHDDQHEPRHRHDGARHDLRVRQGVRRSSAPRRASRRASATPTPGFTGCSPARTRTAGQWAAAIRTIAIALRHDPRIARELIRDVHRMRSATSS